MTTGCATLTFTLTLTPASASAAAPALEAAPALAGARANTEAIPEAIRRWTHSRVTALIAKALAIVATSMIIDAVLYGIASRSTSAGLARYLAAWSASAQPMGPALALAVFGMLAATAGATVGCVTTWDFTGYPALLLAMTSSCAWAATALRRLQSWA